MNFTCDSHAYRDPLGHRRIVVADNYIDAADSLTTLLRCLGFDAKAVYDGPGAILKAQTFQPHIVLLDLVLPHIDGYRAAAAIKTLPITPLLVAWTGLGSAEERAKTRAAGFHHHFEKTDLENLWKLLSSFHKR